MRGRGILHNCTYVQIVHLPQRNDWYIGPTELVQQLLTVHMGTSRNLTDMVFWLISLAYPSWEEWVFLLVQMVYTCLCGALRKGGGSQHPVTSPTNNHPKKQQIRVYMFNDDISVILFLAWILPSSLWLKRQCMHTVVRSSGWWCCVTESKASKLSFEKNK